MLRIILIIEFSLVAFVRSSVSDEDQQREILKRMKRSSAGEDILSVIEEVDHENEKCNAGFFFDLSTLSCRECEIACIGKRHCKNKCKTDMLLEEVNKLRQSEDTSKQILVFSMAGICFMMVITIVVFGRRINPSSTPEQRRRQLAFSRPRRAQSVREYREDPGSLLVNTEVPTPCGGIIDIPSDDRLSNRTDSCSDFSDEETRIKEPYERHVVREVNVVNEKA